MKNEIEAKFANISISETRKKLEALGATCVRPMSDMRRVTIDGPVMKEKDAFLRVRDEGDKTTLTYKQFDSLSIDGVKEIEVTVSSFDDTIEIFKQAGLPYGSMQESRREIWKLGDTEIMIDEWPWLHPYLEIEAPEEMLVKEMAAKLELDWDDALFGDVMAAYRAQYPQLNPKDTVGNIDFVRFNDPFPEVWNK